MKAWIKKLSPVLLAFVMLVGGSACAPSSSQLPTHEALTSTPVFPATLAPATSRSCQSTLDDGVSPSFRQDAPVRTVVGHGHIVTGVVLSSVDCKPIAGAKLEFWPEEAGLGHPDSSRATFFTDDDGRYRFESNPPEHIHMRISAEGYRTIGVNSYHPNGAAEGTFDIVLEPEP